MSLDQKTLLVIGGGAAGFFCAINAAGEGMKVLLLEKTGKLLQKVKISGGGRCNVTHACFEIDTLAAAYPRGGRLVKKAFHHFQPRDTVDWFAQRGVTLKKEPDGRMFPQSDTSQTIINCLLSEAQNLGVEIHVNQPVLSIAPAEKGWTVHTINRVFNADFVCVAVGGFAKSAMLEGLIRNTGHTVIDPVPSLFTFNLPGHAITALMGISVPQARVKIDGTSFESTGPVLITHWGLSGPAVLRTSAFAARFLAGCDYQYKVLVNWAPAWNEPTLREKIKTHREIKGGQKMANTDWLDLPQRLWEFLLQQSNIDPQIRWAQLAASAQNRLISLLTRHELPARGKTTYKDEFVTAGGISLAEIEPNTMESRLQKNLFFAGEVMDVDGITGGFNFQHAWTSGWLAARAIRHRCMPQARS